MNDSATRTLCATPDLTEVRPPAESEDAQGRRKRQAPGDEQEEEGEEECEFEIRYHPEFMDRVSA